MYTHLNDDLRALITRQHRGIYSASLDVVHAFVYYGVHFGMNHICVLVFIQVDTALGPWEVIIAYSNRKA